MLCRWARYASQVIKIPSMGDSISEGTIKEFSRKVGDFVKSDEEVAKVETDKVDVPINSPVSGKITKILVDEDTNVLVGQDFMEVDIDATQPSPNQTPHMPPTTPNNNTELSSTSTYNKSTSTSRSSEATEPLKVPNLADSISEGNLSQWNKQPGDFVKQDELLATIETDKVDVPINSPINAQVIQLLADESTTVQVGQHIADLMPVSPENMPTATTNSSNTNASSPAVQTTSGPSVSNAVITSPSTSTSTSTATSTTKTATSEKAPVAVSFSRAEQRVKMNRMRLKISQHLKDSQNTAASLTTFNEIDMTQLIRMRKAYKDAILKKYDLKFGYMSAFLKASALGMEDVPEINAVIKDNDIVYRDYVDVSFAVATPKGLVTPVIRNVESKTLIQVEEEIAAMGVKAKENKITLEDMAGGTYTVSNGGVFGSLYGTPIINMPQSAILGMHAIKDRPIAVNGEVSCVDVGTGETHDVCGLDV